MMACSKCGRPVNVDSGWTHLRINQIWVTDSEGDLVSSGNNDFILCQRCGELLWEFLGITPRFVVNGHIDPDFESAVQGMIGSSEED